MPVQVGVDKLYYAICTQDDAFGVAYQAPVAIPGAIKIGVDPGGSVDVLYADDGPSEAASVVGAIKVSLNVKDLTLETQAALLGHSLIGGVLVQKTTDSAPDVAILFRSRKSNGKYRFIKLLKGKFTVPKTDYETQEDKTKYQTPTIEGSFLRREYDKAYKKIGDEDHADWVTATGTNWFTTVEDANSALSIATSPLDGATNVAVGANITFTFNNAINASQVCDDYFYLVDITEGTVVEVALSINAAKKVVTLDPTENLAPATSYIAVASGLVQDIYGQKIASGTTIVNFTTT